MIQGNVLDLAATYEVSNVSGSMTLKYGGAVSVTLDFTKDEKFADGEAFAAAINEKLAKESITISGNTYTADKKMKAVYHADSQTIAFEEVGSAGNGVRVTSATGDLAARQAIADDLNLRYDANIRPGDLFII